MNFRIGQEAIFVHGAGSIPVRILALYTDASSQEPYAVCKNARWPSAVEEYVKLEWLRPVPLNKEQTRKILRVVR